MSSYKVLICLEFNEKRLFGKLSKSNFLDSLNTLFDLGKKLSDVIEIEENEEGNKGFSKNIIISSIEKCFSDLDISITINESLEPSGPFDDEDFDCVLDILPSVESTVLYRGVVEYESENISESEIKEDWVMIPHSFDDIVCDDYEQGFVCELSELDKFINFLVENRGKVLYGQKWGKDKPYKIILGI